MKDNKEKNTVVGTYQNSKNFGFVVPDDTSLGTDIFISKKNKNKAKNNQKVLVKITKYPEKKEKCRRKDNWSNRKYKPSRCGYALPC